MKCCCALAISASFSERAFSCASRSASCFSWALLTSSRCFSHMATISVRATLISRSTDWAISRSILFVSAAEAEEEKDLERLLFDFLSSFSASSFLSFFFLSSFEFDLDLLRWDDEAEEARDDDEEPSLLLSSSESESDLRLFLALSFLLLSFLPFDEEAAPRRRAALSSSDESASLLSEADESSDGRRRDFFSGSFPFPFFALLPPPPPPNICLPPRWCLLLPPRPLSLSSLTSEIAPSSLSLSSSLLRRFGFFLEDPPPPPPNWFAKAPEKL